MQHISYSEKESCWQPRQLGQVSGYDEDKATAPSSGLYYSIEFVSFLPLLVLALAQVLALHLLCTLIQ
jgi:hypothetical protein